MIHHIMGNKEEDEWIRHSNPEKLGWILCNRVEKTDKRVMSLRGSASIYEFGENKQASFV